MQKKGKRRLGWDHKQKVYDIAYVLYVEGTEIRLFLGDRIQDHKYYGKILDEDFCLSLKVVEEREEILKNQSRGSIIPWIVISEVFTSTTSPFIGH